jgi:hypothetical protein
MLSLPHQIKIAAAGAISEDLDDEQVRDLINEILGQDEGGTNTIGAAEYLGCAESTLRLHRRKGIGPEYERDDSGRIIYRYRNLRKYRARNVVQPVVIAA